LRVVKVRGNGDDGLRHRLTQISFRIRLQLLKNHGGDFGRRIGLAIDGYFFIGAHLTLDGNNGAVGVDNRLTLSNLTDHALAILGEGHNGRRGARAFGVGNDNGLAAFHNGDTGVGRTKVNTDNLAHKEASFKTIKLDCLL